MSRDLRLFLDSFLLISSSRNLFYCTKEGIIVLGCESPSWLKVFESINSKPWMIRNNTVSIINRQLGGRICKLVVKIACSLYSELGARSYSKCLSLDSLSILRQRCSEIGNFPRNNVNSKLPMTLKPEPRPQVVVMSQLGTITRKGNKIVWLR